MKGKKKNNNAVYILSVDGKDLYITNNLETDKGKSSIMGYNTKTKDEGYNTKKYISSLDYSLDLLKLKSTDYSIYRNKKFSFKNEHGKEFSNKLINVNFKYSNKEFNQLGKNIYIRSGYTHQQTTFEDGACIENDQLIAIKLDEEIESPVDESYILPYFTYNSTIKKYERTNKKIKTLNSVQQIREYLYTNGFYCNGTRYVRYKRSAGSSRVGKCLFIDEALYKRMHKWDLCGLNIKAGNTIDLAAFESYIALTSSSIIDTLRIKKNNILVIDDYDSVFKDNVITVKIENGKLITKEEQAEIANSIWDGQSIIDKSLIQKYWDKGMVLLRNRFFKSCCFNANVQKFFEDNNVTNVSQLNGFTLANDIKDIKLITTKSSIKYLKFGTLKKWFKNIDENFGIVKYEKPTPYFEGNLVQAHYQLLNTLQFSQQELNEFMSPTIEFMKLLRDNPDVLKYYIKYPQDGINVEKIDNKNDLIFKLMGINSKFHETKLYNDFKKDLIKSFVKNTRSGHVLISGNYSTLCGNPIEMLLSSINRFSGESLIGKGNIYSTRFTFNQMLLGSRSPHVTMGNVLLAKNKYNKLIETYMNSTDEILYINSIGENILERLNGADFDSDSLLLTDDKMLISLADKNYNKFKVPTSLVEAKKISRIYNKSELADLDIKTSVNKIGEIINLSQELNSILWDNLNKYKDYDYSDIYLDICKLAVMSCIEIDKAKKEFDIDTVKELFKIRTKYALYKDIKGQRKRIKPKFFKTITINNGFQINKNIHYQSYRTTMDYLQTAINKECYNFYYADKEKEFLKLSDIISISNYKTYNAKCKQAHKFIYQLRELKNEIKLIWLNDTIENTYKRTIIDELKTNLIKEFNKLKLNNTTMIYLIMCFNNKKYIDISGLLFQIIFNKNEFVELFNTSKHKEEDYININACAYTYGLKYTKNTPKRSTFYNTPTPHTI